ncbi:MAG: hypothetical protein J7603_20495, partial [Pseudacidovorax sp.]|nr:hypothetical protein [Pseudacidovorax sp.]
MRSRQCQHLRQPPGCGRSPWNVMHEGPDALFAMDFLAVCSNPYFVESRLAFLGIDWSQENPRLKSAQEAVDSVSS